jgi:predicted short-subunit dehydrogenase-like oxidoreductase (DUF2520 family)
MRIGLIGCGRVGVTIFYLLRKHNRLVGAYDPNIRNQKAAARLLSIKDNPTYEDLINRSEALFIATPDDKIAEAYKQMQVYFSGKKYVFHFSGILPATVLPKKKNVFRASIHPFATFPRIVIPPKRMRYFLSIEGDPQAIRCGRAIFHSGHFTLKAINKKDKPYYHLIGVFSSNLLLGLLASTYSIAAKGAWTEKEIHQLVYPIIEETLENIRDFGLRDSLSGPLRRGDLETIEKHLLALRNDKRLLKIYKDLSMYIVQNLTSGSKNRRLVKLLSE